jgi:hypothetical protein
VDDNLILDFLHHNLPLSPKIGVESQGSLMFSFSGYARGMPHALDPCLGLEDVYDFVQMVFGLVFLQA